LLDSLLQERHGGNTTSQPRRPVTWSVRPLGRSKEAVYLREWSQGPQFIKSVPETWTYFSPKQQAKDICFYLRKVTYFSQDGASKKKYFLFYFLFILWTIF